MPSSWPPLRLTPPVPVALHYAYEKAGLTIDNQPIPWNAEAVLVHAVVRLASRVRPARKEFSLTLGTRAAAFPAESFQVEGQSAHVHFRLPVPQRAQVIGICWRDTPISQVTVPILSEVDFLQHLGVQMPTVSVVLGGQTVACQAYVAAQAKGGVAAAILAAATSLAPLVDVPMSLEVRTDDGKGTQSYPLTLTPGQRRARQALVSVALAKVPTKPWTASWTIAGRTLAQQTVRPVARLSFTRSVRLVGARYLVEGTDHHLHAMRVLPALGEVTRLGPCFLLTCAEPGLAGWCQLKVLFIENSGTSRPLGTFDLLLSDGPTPLAPGTLSATELAQGAAFEVWCGARCLGRLPLTAAPEATFTAEGGFQLADDFAWSPAAEDQLQDRLGKLQG